MSKNYPTGRECGESHCNANEPRGHCGAIESAWSDCGRAIRAERDALAVELEHTEQVCKDIMSERDRNAIDRDGYRNGQQQLQCLLDAALTDKLALVRDGKKLLAERDALAADNAALRAAGQTLYEAIAIFNIHEDHPKWNDAVRDFAALLAGKEAK
jgi:hypothetical protein